MRQTQKAPLGGGAPEWSVGDGIPEKTRSVRQAARQGGGADYPEQMQVMEVVVGRENMFMALRRVEATQGAAGAGGMSVAELRGYLKVHWPGIKERLLAGRYEPAPVRRVEIPKPGCGGSCAAVSGASGNAPTPAPGT